MSIATLRPAFATATDAGEEPYVEQLARGHRNLRFAEPLEQEFRAYFRRFTLSHIRVAFIAAAILSVSTLPLELTVFGTPAPVLRWYLLLVPGVLLISLIVALGASLLDRDGRLSRACVVFELFFATGLLAWLRVIYAREGVAFPYDTENFICIIIFLLSGQRFANACAIAAAVLLAIVATDALLGMPAELIAGNAFNFLGTAALAGAGGFISEYLTRSNFLHRHINDIRANHDPLTGLLNRRGLHAQLPSLWKQAYRERRPIALMIADIDHFKPYNDTYGHLQGDKALKAVAGILRREAVRRPLDCGARLGGEEFACVWFDVSAHAAEAIAERFRAAVEERGSEHRSAPEGRLTVSCGCAAWVPDTPQVFEELFEAADAALYAAKRSGRNRVLIRDQPGGNGDPDPPPSKVTLLRSA